MNQIKPIIELLKYHLILNAWELFQERIYALLSTKFQSPPNSDDADVYFNLDLVLLLLITYA